MANMKKLLEGLGGDNINVRTLADYTANSGVYASIHIGRLRGTIPLPAALIGVKTEKMKEETQEAFANYVTLGSLRIIPAEAEAKLARIEGAIRYKLERSSIVDGFIPMGRYLVFKNEFEEARTAYFAERDNVLATWETLVADFTVAVDAILVASKLLKREKILLRKELLDAVPDKEYYSGSFSMGLSVRAFPGQPDTSSMDKAISQDLLTSWRDAVVENATACIGTLVQNVFDLCSSAASRYATTGCGNGNSLNGLIAMGDKIKETNVFRNPLLKEAGEKLAGLNLSDSPDEQEEIIEDVLLSTYVYAQETNLDLTFPKKGLSKTVLDGMKALKYPQKTA